MGIDSTHYGGLLIPIFMEKLLDELWLIVGREHKGDWELNPIIQAVKSEVEARERCAILPCVERQSAAARKIVQFGKYQSHCQRLVEWKPGREFNCLFCKGNHRVSDFHVVSNFDQRRDIL